MYKHIVRRATSPYAPNVKSPKALPRIVTSIWPIACLPPGARHYACDTSFAEHRCSALTGTTSSSKLCLGPDTGYSKEQSVECHFKYIQQHGSTSDLGSTSIYQYNTFAYTCRHRLFLVSGLQSRGLRSRKLQVSHGPTPLAAHIARHIFETGQEGTSIHPKRQTPKHAHLVVKATRVIKRTRRICSL